MGEFSWRYADTGEQIVNYQFRPTYLLVPHHFQKKMGKCIIEYCYEGDGLFDGYDIYSLVAKWNRSTIPDIIKKIKNGSWHYDADEKDIQNLQAYYDGTLIKCELRHLGIIMALYDADNQALKYPIKITSEPMDYAQAGQSMIDRLQGWTPEQWDYWAMMD